MKHGRFAGLLTAAVLMLTSMPSMTADAVNNRLETGSADGYNWTLWLEDDHGVLNGKQGRNGAFSCEWSGTLSFRYISGHTFENCVNWRNTESVTVDYKAAEFKSEGSACFGVYGWTKNTLAEFYIIENYGIWHPMRGIAPVLGEVTTDDGTYEIYKVTRNGATPEQGVTHYDQIWSIRKGGRTEGTVDVNAHLRAWESLGLNIGDLYEVSLTIEGYESSGSAAITQNDLKLRDNAAPQPAVTTAAQPGTTVTTSAAPAGVKYGDVSGDNSIDQKDVTLMRRALAGWDVTVDQAAADVNKDGSFDLKDLVILRRFLAGGWGVTL